MCLRFIMKYKLWFWPVLCFIALYRIVISSADSEIDCSTSDTSSGDQNDNAKKIKTHKKCLSCTGKARLLKNEGFITDGFGKYPTNWKCSWFIDSGPNKSAITFSFQNFSTECGWDHVYIHDGSSAYDPLVGVYSGLLLDNSSDQRRIPDVTTWSGKAFVHFSSDPAYIMDGFNLTYKLNGCQKCSGNRMCKEKRCVCAAGWTGGDCDVPLCLMNCAKERCRNDFNCVCQHTSAKCTQMKKQGYWTELLPDPVALTSHQAVVVGDSMWVLGGYNFHFSTSNFFVQRYDLSQQRWETVATNFHSKRFSHSAVAYQDSIYIFGGTDGKDVFSDLWQFDINTKSWVNKTVTSSGTEKFTSPIGVIGHTSHIIGHTLYVIFGYSPKFGFLRVVQMYDIANEKWLLPLNSTLFLSGSYGHSSVYYVETGLIYVYGGFHSRNATSSSLFDTLYSFNPTTLIWMVLKPSGQPSFLHSAVVMDGVMVVFGGNPHNDTSKSTGAKCFSNIMMTYDIACDLWSVLREDTKYLFLSSRYGHSAVVYNSEMYVHGGFSGVVHRDFLRFTPGNCSSFMNKSECNESYLRSGVRCIWDTVRQSCRKTNSFREHSHCAVKNDLNEDVCKNQKNCYLCSSTPATYNCQWVNNSCQMTTGVSSQKTNKSEYCKIGGNALCDMIQSCQLCRMQSGCYWLNGVCKHSHEPKVQLDECSPECDSLQNCTNCTKAGCIWCNSLQQCVNSNAYITSFPYGRCVDWTTNGKCSESQCMQHTTCDSCNKNPMCGWCNHPSDTGIGQCLPGGADSPRLCFPSLWYFFSCPSCQCNGHSVCHKPGNTLCAHCGNNTTGLSCEQCREMYYGNPIQGKGCKECQCNNNADFCSTTTGRCYCRIRGVSGTTCDRCDYKNNYSGDATNGKCYYTLAIDYQYTFDMLKADDRYYTQIIFRSMPPSSNRDMDFKLNCSIGSALVNITYLSASYSEERLYRYNIPCVPELILERKLKRGRFDFSSDANTTFFVYIHNISHPFKLAISFALRSEIDLIKFFVTFFSCFLTLMLLAAAVWKIKQKYTLHQRRRREAVQMEQLAKRPFGVVNVHIEPNVQVIPISALAMSLVKKEAPEAKKRKKTQPNNKPSPIAYQPYKGSKCEVLTLLIRLPTGDDEYTPYCQSGISLATSVSTTGNVRKSSVDHHSKAERRKNRKNLYMTSALSTSDNRV